MNAPNDAPWNPPVGRLIFRTLMWTPERGTSCLGVASKPANERGTTCYESIAEVNTDGDSTPSFCGFINSTSHAEDRSPSGNAITQRLATDEDIARVVRAWQSRYSIYEWVEDIESRVGSLILPEELARVRRIVDAGPWNPPVGRLFVRVTTEAIDLCYRLNDERAFRYAVILVAEHGRAHAGKHVLDERDGHPASYTSESGMLIARRMATDEDLRDLLAAWRASNATLDQWLLSVKLGTWMRPSETKLTRDEFTRLTRLVAEVTGTR